MGDDGVQLGVQNVVSAAKDAPDAVQGLKSSDDPKAAKLGNALDDLLKKLPVAGTGVSGLSLG
ncbi:hypothetical protein [Streptomyces sp. NPDC051214]|uniref:hypothetical protein n=1 Tax=Streptomyces sp. NPDC051214 TaxID=3155282 RepID=UPI003414A806